MRENNFDLIRLFAALQVMILHAVSHLNVPHFGALSAILSYLPGVPIFFVISGFLISMSLERAPSLQKYILNRALRVYPALWVCLFFSIAIFIGSGVKPKSIIDLIIWIFAQITFGQFYNPEFLRVFGVGVINGSLWTIPVELQFYAVLPLLVFVLTKYRLNWMLFIVLAGFLMIYSRSYANHDTIFNKLIGVSLFPYLFFFLVGVYFRKIDEKFTFLFRKKALLWIGIYLTWILIEVAFELPGATGNKLNIVSIIFLGAMVVSLAFTYSSAAARLLKGYDISYGLYIWHMPIINLLIHNQLIGIVGFGLSLAVTCFISVISWRFVESPALALKRYSLRQRGQIIQL